MMNEINLTLAEVPRMEFYVVNAGDPAAMSLVRKLSGAGSRPGRIIPVTEEEYDALKNSVMRIQIPEKAQA